MNAAFKKMLCRLLAVALIMLPFQTGQARMIGTDQVNSAVSAQVDRSFVLEYLNRARTVSEFEALGMSAQDARDRVAAMTDAEVRGLAGKIHALPAGSDGGLIALVLVVFFIWYFAFRR